MRPTAASACITLLLAATACSVSVEPASSTDAGAEKIAALADQLASDAVQAHETAGVSIAVRWHGDVVFAEGYGAADLENDVAASVDTVYRIGSITKQFTAAAVMQLVEQGRVQLQDDMRQYVPEFDTGELVVTVERLLNHTSGIPSYTGLGAAWERTIPLPMSHEELLGLVAGRPFDFEPGAEYAYNNTGFYLLGMLIENVTGASYGEYVEQELAAPLGLGSTVYCDERRILAHRAEGYESVEGELVNDAPVDMTQPFAAGALCSDVGDLLAWQEALAAGKVVSPASYERMTTPGTLNDGSALTYGYGLGIGELEGHRFVRHGGGINGFVTMLARYPDDDLGIVVLTNTPGPVAGRIQDRLARAALDLPEATDEAQ